MQATLIFPEGNASGGIPGLILGPENRDVAVAVERLLLGDRPTGMLVVGRPRSGKTTLLEAVASAAGQLGWRPLEAPCRILQHDDSPERKLLLLDDLDRQLGRRELAPEQIARMLDICPFSILTTTRPPRQLRIPVSLLDRLRQLAVVELQDPRPGTRYLLLCHFARRHNISLPEKHARRLAQQWSLPAGLLEAQLLDLAQGFIPPRLQAALGGSSLSGNARQQVLHVARTTARFYRLGLHQLRGNSRQRQVVHARRMAMFLSRRWLSATLDQIGQVLGGKDHTTVLYHCRQFQQQLQRDAQARSELRQLERLLGFQGAPPSPPG